jgi:hypothetical protein
MNGAYVDKIDFSIFALGFILLLSIVLDLYLILG